MLTGDVHCPLHKATVHPMCNNCDGKSILYPLICFVAIIMLTSQVVPDHLPLLLSVQA